MTDCVRAGPQNEVGPQKRHRDLEGKDKGDRGPVKRGSVR